MTTVCVESVNPGAVDVLRLNVTPAVKRPFNKITFRKRIASFLIIAPFACFANKLVTHV
jgi:hypothetical protein